MGAALPLHLALVHQADERLVDERGGLQGVVGALAAHVVGGQAAQVVVEEDDQPLRGGGVASVHPEEEPGDVTTSHGDGRDRGKGRAAGGGRRLPENIPAARPAVNAVSALPVGDLQHQPVVRGDDFREHRPGLPLQGAGVVGVAR